MDAHQDLQPGMSRLSISSSTHDPSDDILRMTGRHSSVSSEDSWQSPSGLRTPASSLFSEDLETTEPKPRQRSTVIHEEAENLADSTADDDDPTAATAAELAARPRNNHEASAPATPPESPVLPPADLLNNNNNSNQPKRVLQAVEYDLPYTHPTMPWDKFYSSRADYPDSMFESFLKYHQGPLNVLHDLGAGSGLAADGLLSAMRRSQPRDAPTIKLPRTILSDPGEENLGITSRFVHARHSDVAMECWQARGEEQDQFLAPGSVDMTICAEALHWMDMPSAVSQVSRSLRPGGTFAVVLYSCFPRVLNNAHIKRTLRSLVEHHLRTRLLKSPRSDHQDSPIDQDDDHSTSDSDSPAPDSPSSAQLHPNWARGMRSLAYGLDAVELPADQWDNIKRFEINCGTTGWWWPSASKDALGCATPMADASPHERLIYESYDDWGRVASVRELKDLLMSIQVGFGEKTWESPLWKELERAAKGPLHLVWQTHMILARKKGPGLETVPEE
ncbi:hypothetical protein N0V82_008011 [Gnomoniopsis sp. IMI 355080]|nr:hypothetical protein N0V82_008011 [Gnomoniopsis sp. IMI 355080]